MLVRAFSSMPGLAGGVSRSVRDGSVKKYLIQIETHATVTGSAGDSVLR